MLVNVIANGMFWADEVVMLNGFVAVYRANLDVIVYVVGSSGQNEMMMACVLDTFFDVLTELLKYNIILANAVPLTISI